MAAKKITKKSAKVTRPSRAKVVSRTRREKNSTFSEFFRLTESYTSLILGLIVVVIATALLFTFLKNRNVTELNDSQTGVSSTSIIPSLTNIPNGPTGTSGEVAQPSPAITGDSYVVKEGDDLWHIAEAKYNDGYKWVEIAKANNISNGNELSAGMKLVLPALSIARTPEPTSEMNAVSPTNTSQQPAVADRITTSEYTVKRGDDLWAIAVRAYGDGYRWGDIARANGLVNPDIIHSGNVLKIPRS